MATRTRISDAQVIEALKLSGGMPTLAAKRLGCHWSTLYDRIKKVPAVAKVAEYMRQRDLDVAECQLMAAVLRGEAWAVCFLLKCRGKERGYIERAEITGANGGPLQLQVVKNAEELTDDELAAIAAGTGEKQSTKPGRCRSGTTETPTGAEESVVFHELPPTAVCDALAPLPAGEET